jgi:serine/threonine protein phosphatase PrpC
VAPAQCSACSAPVQAIDRYCEACGHELNAPPAADRVPGGSSPDEASGRWLSSADVPEACPACGSTTFGAEGFCDGCGQRRPTARNHTELDLGAVAGASDLGHRHHRNEDAMGIGVIDGAVVTVVCDGVSSSTRPDTASHAAVDAALPALLGALAKGTDPQTATGAAARAAQAATTLVAGPQPGASPPSCTFVCATVTADAVTVGWVGDSRAYWLPDGGGEPACLTTDDSLAGKLAAAGVDVRAIAANPQSGALVRWLGADARDTDAHLRTFVPPGPGRVLVCSDGLFRYRPVVTDLAAAAAKGSPLATAQTLVRLALDEGGHDNVTVVLIPYPPEAPTEGSST